MISFDTNLLIYAHREKAPEHKNAKQAIQDAVDSNKGCGITLPSVSEFWSIVTNPKLGDRPSTPKEAKDFIFALCEDGNIQIWEPHGDFSTRFIQLASDLKIAGPRIFDLQIALIAFENGATELWTNDKAFIQMPGLRIKIPLMG